MTDKKTYPHGEIILMGNRIMSLVSLSAKEDFLRDEGAQSISVYGESALNEIASIRETLVKLEAWLNEESEGQNDRI